MSDRDDKLIMDHEYDGIQEYDNPMPRWWLATLWGTVIFSVLYLLNVPIFGKGQGWIAEYAADSAAAAQVAAQNNPLASVTAETITTAAADPARMAEARTTFTTFCAACHAPDGGGTIGPNLTDEYWIHGSTPLEIFATVNDGVLAQGMPAWGQTLAPDQVINVAAYVTTLRGTTPAAPKAPQGERADSVPAAN